MPECQKINNGGFYQYSAEHFARLILAIIRKKCGNDRVHKQTGGMTKGPA